MPSVGRGSVRTTRQGGPPSPLQKEFHQAVDGILAGAYRGLRAACPWDTSLWLASLLVATLEEKRVPYVHVDGLSGSVRANLGLDEKSLAVAVCDALVAGGEAPLVWARRVADKVSGRGLSAAEKMARSDDRLRRRCGGVMLGVAHVLRRGGGVLGERGREALLRYAALRGGFTVYVGSRPRVWVTALFGPRTVLPPHYVGMSCRDESLQVYFPGAGTWKYRFVQGR